jgi:hypothetical protein
VIKKFVVIMLLGILAYVLLAFSVMRFYKDDPSYMDMADRQKYNLNYLAKLDATRKTKRTTVIKHLGAPDITEAKQVGEQVYQVMFYRTRQIRDDNITTKDECTALLFINGLLIAWGSEAYNQYQSY